MGDITMEILIDNLTEEEAVKMGECIREICEQHGVEISEFKTVKKED